MDSQRMNELSVLLGHLMKNQMLTVQRKLEEHGLCRAQPGIVHILSKCDGLTQVELANKMCVTPATVSAMLKRMERDEVIERRRSLEDQRVTHVYLTDKGKNQAKIVNQVFQELSVQGFGNFTEEELTQAKCILTKLTENFKD
ncbi:MAG: MarR family transcriptional regulator [Turicibacter sp.]|nr:MarR family transcriptional regulator [Turicibacter sp.]